MLQNVLLRFRGVEDHIEITVPGGHDRGRETDLFARFGRIIPSSAGFAEPTFEQTEGSHPPQNGDARNEGKRPVAGETVDVPHKLPNPDRGLGDRLFFERLERFRRNRVRKFPLRSLLARNGGRGDGDVLGQSGRVKIDPAEVAENETLGFERIIVGPDVVGVLFFFHGADADLFPYLGRYFLFAPPGPAGEQSDPKQPSRDPSGLHRPHPFRSRDVVYARGERGDLQRLFRQDLAFRPLARDTEARLFLRGRSDRFGGRSDFGCGFPLFRRFDDRLFDRLRAPKHNRLRFRRFRYGRRGRV